MGKDRMQKEEEGSGQTEVGMRGAMCKKVSRDVAERGRIDKRSIKAYDLLCFPAKILFGCELYRARVRDDEFECGCQ